MLGDTNPSLAKGITDKSTAAICLLRAEASERKSTEFRLLEFLKIEVAKSSVVEIARSLQIDASNLAKIVEGKRAIGRELQYQLLRRRSESDQLR